MDVISVPHNTSLAHFCCTQPFNSIFPKIKSHFLCKRKIFPENIIENYVYSHPSCWHVGDILIWNIRFNHSLGIRWPVLLSRILLRGSDMSWLSSRTNRSRGCQLSSSQSPVAGPAVLPGDCVYTCDLWPPERDLTPRLSWCPARKLGCFLMRIY